MPVITLEGSKLSKVERITKEISKVKKVMNIIIQL